MSDKKKPTKPKKTKKPPIERQVWFLDGPEVEKDCLVLHLSRNVKEPASHDPDNVVWKMQKLDLELELCGEESLEELAKAIEELIRHYRDDDVEVE